MGLMMAYFSLRHRWSQSTLSTYAYHHYQALWFQEGIPGLAVCVVWSYLQLSLLIISGTDFEILQTSCKIHRYRRSPLVLCPGISADVQRHHEFFRGRDVKDPSQSFLSEKRASELKPLQPIPLYSSGFRLLDTSAGKRRLLGL